MDVGLRDLKRRLSDYLDEAAGRIIGSRTAASPRPYSCRYPAASSLTEVLPQAGFAGETVLSQRAYGAARRPGFESTDVITEDRHA